MNFYKFMFLLVFTIFAFCFIKKSEASELDIASIVEENGFDKAKEILKEYDINLLSYDVSYHKSNSSLRHLNEDDYKMELITCIKSEGVVEVESKITALKNEVFKGPTDYLSIEYDPSCATLLSYEAVENSKGLTGYYGLVIFSIPDDEMNKGDISRSKIELNVKTDTPIYSKFIHTYSTLGSINYSSDYEIVNSSELSSDESLGAGGFALKVNLTGRIYQWYINTYSNITI